MNYFIADLHLGHKNCLAFDNRPFVDIEQQTETYIENHNKIVGKSDDVYFLGDFSWYNVDRTADILDELNGNKHLISGNHDHVMLRHLSIFDRFSEIRDYKELQFGRGKILVLSHYPIPCFNKHFYGSYHFYGHVHNGFEENMMQHVKLEMRALYDKPCNMFNAGCMMPYMDYTPRTFEEITEGII